MRQCYHQSPCRTELWQHFLRTVYISRVWCNADKKDPLLTEDKYKLLPSNFGSTINDDEQLDFKWFDGLQLPETVDEIRIKRSSKYFKKFIFQLNSSMFRNFW